MDEQTIKAMLTIVVWIAGMLACFMSVRSRSDESAFVNFIGAAIFWPLMLPIFVSASAFRAGIAFGDGFIERRRARRNRLELRAGADNGLYE